MSDGDNLLIGLRNNGSSATEIFRTSPPQGVDTIYIQTDSGNCLRTYTDEGWGIEGTGEGNGGVRGSTKGGIGVQAFSYDEYGGFSEGGNIGLFARNRLSGFNAYLGTRGLAGDFYGDVFIHGGLSVVNGPKSGVVPHPDGSHRQLYCIESPEMWFEDFGKGHLVDGVADVKLDPEFVALVDSSDYYIFLTEYGDSAGLYVSGQSPNAFVVRERSGGTNCLPFRYRVVARRKDIVRPRLEKVKVPTPATVPESPEVPRPKPYPIY